MEAPGDALRSVNVRHALLEAARCGDVVALHKALSAGAEIDARYRCNHTALTVSASNGHEACVNALIEAGADVNARTNYGVSALVMSADWNSKACLRALLDTGRCADAALVAASVAERG